MSAKYDRAAAQLDAMLPTGPRVVVIGSTSFWHPESRQLCQLLGEELAARFRLTLITGGVEGVGETVGRSFFATRSAVAQPPSVYHVLPHHCPPWDYGVTLHAGDDMAERREVLGRLGRVYVVIEGGPGTAHEAMVASGRSAWIIPVGRSGGHAAELYAELSAQRQADAAIWRTLGDAAVPLHETTAAVAKLVDKFASLP